MHHIITKIIARQKSLLEARFIGGEIKQYNIKKMVPYFPQLKRLLEDEDLFKQVKLEVGGVGVYWNDELDLDSEDIWYDGELIRIEKVDSSEMLAANLAAMRNRKGFTQKDLAEKSGITQADISRIERARSNPSVDTLKRLAEGMGTKLNISFDDGFIQELDDAVRIWNTGDKMDMLLTATQKDQAIKEEKARQEGIAEGKKEKAIEDARALKQRKVSVDIIAESIGLSVEEVNAL